MCACSRGGALGGQGTTQRGADEPGRRTTSRTRTRSGSRRTWAGSRSSRALTTRTRTSQCWFGTDEDLEGWEDEDLEGWEDEDMDDDDRVHEEGDITHMTDCSQVGDNAGRSLRAWWNTRGSRTEGAGDGRTYVRYGARLDSE